MVDNARMPRRDPRQRATKMPDVPALQFYDYVDMLSGPVIIVLLIGVVVALL
jgi:hypothetical protein